MGRVALIVSGAVLISANPAIAQTSTTGDSAGPASDQAVVDNEIVVTARKRSETLIDVPLSLTAVTAQAIERANITKIDEISALAPNVQLQPSPVGPTNLAPYIRGIGQRSQEPSQDLPIAISIDGVYLTDMAGSRFEIFDVDRVEVLRGPQGILQGRNSPGGALNVITKRPTGTFGARIEGSYERFDKVHLNAEINAPIVADMLSARLSAFAIDGGSYVKNLFSGKDIGGERAWGGRLGFLLTPSDTLTAYLVADYVRDRSEHAPTRLASYGSAQGPRQPVPVVCAVYGYCTTLGKYETTADFTDRSSSKNGGVSLTVDWDLGGPTLTSVTGYRFVNELQNTDLDNTPDVVVHLPMRDMRVRSTSQELRLSSGSGAPFQYVLGVYALRSKFDLHEPKSIGSGVAGIPGPPFFPIDIASARSQVTRSFAVFGQASYDITDQWSISGGARQTFDRKRMTSIPNFPAATPADIGRRKVSNDNLSIELGTEYKFGPATMGYLRFAQGYRSGGINGDAPTVGSVTTFRPEKLNSYEIGLKSEWLDRRLSTNLSAFYYDFKDNQIVAVDNIGGVVLSRVVNADGLKVYGIEFESSFRATPDLILSSSVGYLRPRYKHQIVDIGFGANTDLHDLRKEYSPRLSGRVAVDYSVKLDPGEIVFHADLSYKSKLTTSPVDNPIAAQSAYALLNGSVGYKTPSWSVELYGQNLTNKFYITSGETAGGLVAWQTVGRPRTYGIRVGANF